MFLLPIIQYFFATALLLLTPAQESSSKYNPLSISPQTKATVRDFSVNDKQRNRDIPVRVYLPEQKTQAPVILFSHGLGGSKEGCAYLGKHWSQRGYVVVFLQHPGSDDSVWKDVPLLRRLAAMRKAANAQNFQLRVKDVPAVLDQLEKWQKEKGHALYGRLDLSKVGMSGHSFGALTTQAVSGQSALGGLVQFTDRRIKAALPMSPSSPRGGNPERAFAKVQIPWLLMTGTKDEAIIGNADLESRLAVFPALPSGNKYEVVLDNAEHSAFSDRALPGDKENRNPNHHRVILALSTAFWDAYLRNDRHARDWLDGDGPRTIMEKKDRWQKK